MKRSLFVIIPILLSMVLSLNFFWIKPLVPGFDSPFYLSEIRNFSRMPPNPLEYIYTNRYLTIAVPGTISNIFNTDPVTSYRVVITAVYISIAIALYLFIKNITKNKLESCAVTSAIVISPFLLTYSTMLYANFASFLVLFVFFAIESGNNFKGKNILLGFIFGLIFYVHNFSSVSISLIIITYFLMSALIKRDANTLFNGLLILLTGISVGCITLGQYIGTNPFIVLAFSIILITILEIISLRPKLLCKRNVMIAISLFVIFIATQFFFKNPDFSKLFKEISHFGNSFQPVLLGNEKQRIIDSFKEYSGKYWLYFFPPFLLFSLIINRKELKNSNSKYIFPFAIFLPSIILTFQPLFHLNFLPERFASLVVVSTYFFYIGLISLPSYKKYLIALSVLPLFLNYLSSDSLILNKGYRSITGGETQMYEQIKLQIPSGSTIMLPSDHDYWGRYFLDGYEVVSGDSQISCGYVKEPKYYGNINFTLAQLLGENDTQKGIEILSRLKKYYPDQTVYLLVDTNIGCGHGRVLESLTKAKQIIHQNNWKLYEID